MHLLDPPVLRAGLLLVGVALAAVVAARARRTARGPAPWWCLAAAVLLLAVADLTHGGDARAPWWSLVVGLVGCVLLYATQMQLLRRRLDDHLVEGVLDSLGGVAVATAVVCAVLLGPLRAAPGVGSAEALLLLLRPAASLLLLAFTITGVLLVREGRDRRARLVVLATAMIFLLDAAAVVVPVLGDERPGWAAAGSAAHLLPLLLLTLAAHAPEGERGERIEADTRTILLGPAAFVVTSGALLGWSHVDRLPTPAVVAALVSLALVVIKVGVVFRRVTGLRSSRRDSLTDDLTGLGNRRALTAALEPVGRGAPLALVLLDLDRFKEVNDVLGHAAGDQLLRQVAARLRAAGPAGTHVVRQGGDEFALVLPGTGAVEAAELARDVTRDLALPYDLGGREVVVAASAGVSAAPEHATSAEVLLHQADAAMYLAKAAPGAVVVVHDRVVEAERQDRLQLGLDLRAAVARRALAVHFQPQLDAVTGELVGVEALVRWPHPTRGMLAPDAFLGLVEELGLMDDLTEQVLDRSLAASAAWRAAAPGGATPDGTTAAGAVAGGAPAAGAPHAVRVSVNISATCLLNPHLIDTVARALHTHGVPPDELLLEITETELMLDAATSHRVVLALVDLGVGVSIDDYGTGYSSLSYLKDLPASELKLDRSFTAALGTDPRAAAIVRTTVDLAHSLGLRMVAEGVEDAEALADLQRLGVDVTQGYHHSRPLPEAELVAWLAARRAAVSTTGT